MIADLGDLFRKAELFFRIPQGRSQDYPYGAYLITAQDLLRDVAIGEDDIQQMLEFASVLNRHHDYLYFGVFLSEMMRKALGTHPILRLNTLNYSQVHDPRLFGISIDDIEREEEVPIPSSANDYQESLRMLYDFYRRQGLISFLAGELTDGSIMIEGNVGAFFGHNNGAQTIRHQGESGWRPLVGMKTGTAVLEGIIGHGLATDSLGGIIHANGLVRSVGHSDRYGSHVKLYHNGKEISAPHPIGVNV